MHMTGNNNPKDSKSFLFQGRPSQGFGEPSAPTSATAKVYSVGDVGPGGGVVFYVHSDEIAFYDAITQNGSAVFVEVFTELGDEVLRELTHKLVKIVKKRAKLSWTKRERETRPAVERLLRKYKYPPDRQETAVSLVLEQAELFAQKQAPRGMFTSVGSDGGLNCKYLEAAPADLEGVFEWCNIFTVFSPLGVEATGIGTGMANTTTAVNECARRRPHQNTTSSAIHAAANYVNNGKSDWHLPSRDELNKLYKYASPAPSGGARRELRPSFSPGAYWSSSEASATYAWYQDFYDGYQFNFFKAYSIRVRPVRAF
jgi:hypothetical protein